MIYAMLKIIFQLLFRIVFRARVIGAENLPQQGAVCMEQLGAVQQHPAGVVATLPGQQARHAHGSDGLSGAGFAHQAQDLAVVDGEGNTAHRLPVPVVEFHMQVLDLQHQPTPLSRRCSPSPMRPTPNTSSTIIRPVLMTYQGAFSIPWASESI